MAPRKSINTGKIQIWKGMYRENEGTMDWQVITVLIVYLPAHLHVQCNFDGSSYMTLQPTDTNTTHMEFGHDG